MKKPDSETLGEINFCTEENHHLQANALVAKWCAKNYEGDDWTVKPRFLYFKDYFERLLAHVKEVEIVPFWMISYEMGKELDREIVRDFGQEIPIFSIRRDDFG